MPPLERQQLGNKIEAKFIRIKEYIFTGRHLGDNHKRIAEMDQLTAIIDELKSSNQTQVDAGFYSVTRLGEIIVTGNSDSLEIPIKQAEDKAREITIKRFQEINPEYTIIKLK